MGMKNQNPAMNVTLLDARKLRTFLNRVGFIVDAIECNPNVTGARTISMCPEVNIPDTTEPLNLEFRFASVKASYPVAQIRDILGERPALEQIRTLHKTLWPSANLDTLSGKLMVVPEVQQLVSGVVGKLSRECREK